MRTLNLGILAHVDAGKTTLTERLLYAAGVIDTVGSVDKGTTQTDTLDLERQRGITIKAAVVSFAIDDVTVNLIDTPGHPDFIAEVERALSVLDGVVLVVSAVEGVQPQTRVLMRALQRLRIPTLLFVNKIDRPGASEAGTLTAIAARLTASIVPMGSTRGLGTPAAEFVPFTAGDASFRATLGEVLADHDERMLAAFVSNDAGVSFAQLQRGLAAQVGRALVHPVFFGSAITGAGMESLVGGIVAYLPSTAGNAAGPASGAVFKIDRGGAGEKIAYVRLFSGTVRVRDRVRFATGVEEKVTAMAVFDGGPAAPRPSASAGQIAKLWGLAAVRVGDTFGDVATRRARHRFDRPTLESVVEPLRDEDRGRLREALAQLAEQDPLIDVRQDDARREITVSLYGEVQKEVIGATLAREYGVDVAFRETTPIYIERPIGTGEASEVLRAKSKSNVTGRSSPTSSNPFLATLGLRIGPAPVDSGVAVTLAVDVRLVPIYVYKTVDLFMEMMREYVTEALQEGLFGWRVTDCAVAVTDCGYRAPGTTAADVHRLTRLVLAQALERAGTKVCEPMARVSVEVPTDATGAVLSALARLGAAGETRSVGALSLLEIILPVARVQDLRRQLPGLTGGEGVLESQFVGYRPVSGAAPRRNRG
ncbi:MAG: TetM/TetW/TetO/TetS family tetracycline resistance ribosomal protection protein [Chloroflexota bacterium]|nr:TetM/TetW/TetO/TetS family tetracycline resistance ribosomal protection protein [Chloroflexota bacterium]